MGAGWIGGLGAGWFDPTGAGWSDSGRGSGGPFAMRWTNRLQISKWPR